MRQIFTSCIVSIILFLAGMNVILEFISAGINISIFQSFLSPPVKGFMDDHFFMSPSLQQTQVLLNGVAIVLSWGRISLKLSKSRNLVFAKGKILNENAFSIKVNKTIHFIKAITEKPVRFQGRAISDSLSDRN